MTVYCVKCGKPNTAQASSCASCGIELKKPKKKGGRFKGTMMMTNPETFLSTEESQEDHADPPVSDAEPTPDTNPPPPNPSEPPINRPARGRFKQTMVGTPAVNQAIEETKRQAGMADTAQQARPPVVEAIGTRDRVDNWLPEKEPPLPQKRKKRWWIGAGCLVLVAIGCCVTGIVVNSITVPAIMSQGGELAAHASSVPMAKVLSHIASACKNDPSGSLLTEFIHETANDDLIPAICGLDFQSTIIGAPSVPTPQILSSTPDRTYAEAAGVDANRCYRFLSDDAKIIGCWLDARYQLLHVESLR